MAFYLLCYVNIRPAARLGYFVAGETGRRGATHKESCPQNGVVVVTPEIESGRRLLPFAPPLRANLKVRYWPVSDLPSMVGFRPEADVRDKRKKENFYCLTVAPAGPVSGEVILA